MARRIGKHEKGSRKSVGDRGQVMEKALKLSEAEIEKAYQRRVSESSQSNQIQALIP